MRKHWSWSLISILAIFSLVVFAGCGDDDSDTGTNPGGGGGGNVDSATAQIYAPQVASLIGTMALSSALAADDVGQLGGFGGGLGGLARTAPLERAVPGDPVYDSSTGYFTATYNDSFTEPGYEYSIATTNMARYNDATGNPVNVLVDETPVARALFSSDTAYRLSTSGEGTTSTINMALDAALEIGGLLTSTYGITGSGNWRISSVYTSPQASGTFDFTMAYGINVSVPAAGSGCPNGSSFATFGAYRVDVTYNGTGNATWTLEESGSQIASGTTMLYCGITAN